jgi:hypothetical protein
MIGSPLDVKGPATNDTTTTTLRAVEQLQL